MVVTTGHRVDDVVFLLLNLVSSCAIVFANKLVLTTISYKFAVALTSIHTLATLVSARLLRIAGVIDAKTIPKRAVAALAGVFTGYIILCNVSLALNSVGFYQLTKIAIAPTVLIMDAFAQRRLPAANVTGCVLLVCFGIGLATVYDKEVMTNTSGIIVGVASVVVSAQYGTLIGSMAKQYEVTSLQLLDQYLPYASLMMAVCVPVESFVIKLGDNNAETMFTFHYNTLAVSLIAFSAILGVAVTFSTFLVIGSTSPLTYAIAGHVKTVVILGGGVVIFGDRLSPVKSAGVLLALIGVVMYTRVKLSNDQLEERK
jgi:solute carrier family 35, member E3